jgi:hypothetical protein
MAKSKRTKLDHGTINSIRDALNLCQELPMMEVSLREAGMHKTAVLFNKAVQAAGYEVATMMHKAKLVKGKR